MGGCKVSEVFVVDHEAFQAVDLSLSLAVMWWTLEESHRVMDDPRPNLISVLPFGHGEDGGHHFWPPPKRRTRLPSAPAALFAEPLELYDEPIDDPDNDPDDFLEPDCDLEAELEGLLDTLYGVQMDGAEAPLDEASHSPLAAAEGQDAHTVAMASPPAPSLPPLPPPSAPPTPPESVASSRKPQTRGPVGKADVVVAVLGGTIRYYSKIDSFVAKCSNPAHGRCELTRKASGSASSSSGAAKGGRPVGFMASWLGESFETATKADHWSRTTMVQMRHQRLLCRRIVQACSGGDVLLSHERAKIVGEESEAESVSAYC
jgi:hypothetical protein